VRPWARWSASIFFVVFVATAAYFVPVQFRMQGDAGAQWPRAELAAMLARFVALNWVRQGLLVVALVSAVHALGLSYRAASVSATSTSGRATADGPVRSHAPQP
jgi:hypothetical protein